MQILFLWDSHSEADYTMAQQVVADADAELHQPAMQMAGGAWEQRQVIDARVEKVAPQWPVRRQPRVDRSLLRLAVWEMTNSDTPPKVVIDEAIEMAKAFSTEQSAAFVNGVLDAIHRENEELKGS